MLVSIKEALLYYVLSPVLFSIKGGSPIMLVSIKEALLYYVLSPVLFSI
mgnify:CR=1 FL=1